MKENILHYFLTRRRKQYSREFLAKHSVSSYLIGITTLSMIVIPTYFNTYVLKYILPIIVASIIVCLIEIYFRYKLKQEISIVLLVLVLLLHFIPFYYWIKKNKVEKDYLFLIILNFIIGLVIVVIYYLTNKWPYYETPFEIMIVAILTNIIFYYTLIISSSSLLE